MDTTSCDDHASFNWDLGLIHTGQVAYYRTGYIRWREYMPAVAHQH